MLSISLSSISKVSNVSSHDHKTISMKNAGESRNRYKVKKDNQQLNAIKYDPMLRTILARAVDLASKIEGETDTKS